VSPQVKRRRRIVLSEIAAGERRAGTGGEQVGSAVMQMDEEGRVATPRLVKRAKPPPLVEEQATALNHLRASQVDAAHAARRAA